MCVHLLVLCARGNQMDVMCGFAGSFFSFRRSVSPALQFRRVATLNDVETEKDYIPRVIAASLHGDFLTQIHKYTKRHAGVLSCFHRHSRNRAKERERGARRKAQAREERLRAPERSDACMHRRPAQTSLAASGQLRHST